MRVILKPAGLLSVLGILVILGLLAVFRVQQVKEEKAAAQRRAIALAQVATSSRPTPTPTSAQTTLLKNADFEGAFVPVRVQKEGAAPNFEATGTLAKEWADNSLWAASVVKYNMETQNPHGGKQCQKMTLVKRMETRGQLQFIQVVPLEPEMRYRASIWVRASKKTTVTFGLRGVSMGFYEDKKVATTVDENWQKLELSVKVTNPDAGANTFFMVILNEPGVTLWVDDATLEQVGT